MKVAIVEDHKIIAEALERTLKKHPVIKDIRIFLSGDELLNSSLEWLPQLIISDLLMPGTHGIDLIKAYKARMGKPLKLVILTSVTNKVTLKQAIKQNVNAYLSKSESLEEFLQAINKVLIGQKYISPSFNLKTDTLQPEDTEIGYHLSPREKEVLRLVCSGRIMKEVAEDLNLSNHTVQSYLKNILQKFKVKRTTDLVRVAIQQGFYSPDERVEAKP